MNETTDNAMNAIKTYFRGVRTEWGKITWPEKHQVVAETTFVIAVVLVFTLFIFLVDKIFGWLLSFIHTV